MGITPGGVHEKGTLVPANGTGERLGSVADEDVPPTSGAGDGDVDALSEGVEKVGEDDLALELGVADLSLDAAAIDGNVSEVRQQLLGTVLGLQKGEERRSIINERSPAVTGDEGLVSEERSQEGNVGLDSADSELDEGTEDLSPGNLEGRAVASALDQHGVVMGSDDGTGETVTTVKTDSVTASRSVDLNLSGVGLEVLAGVLGGDTALDGISTGGDAVLGKTELLKGGASGDLDLSGNDIDTGNLLGDGVLDLDSGVDLDEVVAVLLVDQELGGTGVAVPDRLGQAHGIGKDSLSDVLGKILRRRNLNDLLMSALDGAVTLVQMHNVSVVITEKLDLNVLGSVEEALNEDGAVSEG